MCIIMFWCIDDWYDQHSRTDEVGLDACQTPREESVGESEREEAGEARQEH